MTSTNPMFHSFVQLALPVLVGTGVTIVPTQDNTLEITDHGKTVCTVKPVSHSKVRLVYGGIDHGELRSQEAVEELTQIITKPHD